MSTTRSPARSTRANRLPHARVASGSARTASGMLSLAAVAQPLSDPAGLGHRGDDEGHVRLLGRVEAYAGIDLEEASGTRSGKRQAPAAALASSDEVAACLGAGKLPVVVDPACSIRHQLKPWGLVDAILAKRNCGTTMQDASVVVGVGPGFTAGQDVHKVVEPMRGHDLGRVIMKGSAQPNTGIPGDIGGYTLERLVKAPCDGKFRAVRSIGDTVGAGEVLAYVADQPVIGKIDGVLRGLLHDGLTVNAGMKIGDIDPRAKIEHCWTISDKARAIGGGVLEALLMTEPCSRVPSV